MSDKPCVVTINGSDYYYPCDRRDDIVLIDNHLVNVSSSSITLYHDFVVQGDNTSGYPRITLPSNTEGYIRSSYNSTNTTLIVNSIEWKTSRLSYSLYLDIVLIGVLLLNLFKRR